MTKFGAKYSMFLSLCLSGNLFARTLSKFETVPQGEEQMTNALIAKISEQIKKKRDAHAKDHGCVDGVTVKVKDNLGALQIGPFATPNYEYTGAIIRLSHGSGNPKANDNDKGGHGFALKIPLPEEQQALVEDIPGEEMFMDKKYYKSFDIITISALHEFMVSTVADYPEFFAVTGAIAKIKADVLAGVIPPNEAGPLIQKTMNDLYLHLDSTDPAQKKRPTEAALIGVTSQYETFDLFESVNTYQSWVPSLYGNDTAVKYQFRPVACEASAGTPQNPLQGKALMESLGVQNDPNRLKETLKARLVQGPTCYELAVHVLESGSEALVESAEKAWPGREKPDAYKAVATLTIPQKAQGQELIDPAVCEKMSMNPGHAPKGFVGIGGIQRSRTLIYAAIESLRNKQMLGLVPLPE